MTQVMQFFQDNWPGIVYTGICLLLVIAISKAGDKNKGND